jgi:hypothetical protein
MRDDIGHEVHLNGETEAELIADTGKAILVQFGIADCQEWIPESQIHEDSELYSGCDIGRTGAVVVTEWFARQKRWL